MLDLGFLPDVERILQLTPPGRQTMLFSATMPGEIVTLARRHLPAHPHPGRAARRAAHVPSTEQHVFRAHQMDKVEVLARVLQAEGRGLTIVFCRTKRSVDQVATTLTTKGFAAAAVHGDLGQSQRERAMRAFRSGKVDVLVATDVAARGLDVDDVTHVINYECPEDEKAYLHRIGRTGRAGREGVAVTFVDWNDLHRWKTINETLHLDFPEPLETYSTSAHLYRPWASRRARPASCRAHSGSGPVLRPRTLRTSARPARPGRAPARGTAARTPGPQMAVPRPAGPRTAGPRTAAVAAGIRMARGTRGRAGSAPVAGPGAASRTRPATGRPVSLPPHPALAGAPGLASVPGDGQAGHSGAASTGQASAGQAGESSGNPDAPRRPRRRRPRSRSTSGQATAE